MSSHDSQASSRSGELDRRGFLKGAAAGVGAAAIGASALQTLGAEAAAGSATKINEKDLIWRSREPGMEYRRLGRTNFMCSRIVEGNGGDITLWRRLLAKGMNYFDTARGYGNFEIELKPLLAKYRDKLWITSKATGVAGYDRVDPGVADLYKKAMKDFLGDKFDGLEGGGGGGRRGPDLLVYHKAAVEKQKATGEKPDLRPAGKRIAEMYSTKLDESLERLGTDHVDAYFMHGVEIPWMFDCLEVWETYEKAHKAGKVKHFGFSTHNHQQEVLAAAGVANEKGPWKIDLIMPGINPVTFDDWRKEMDVLRKQDVGIVAMKTSAMKGRSVDGKVSKLKEMMDGKEYNEWERCKLYMLHLTDKSIDACIARMGSNEEMEKDLALPSVKLSTAAARELRSLVKIEMAGACHLCGECQITCPEHIALTDMVRYHSYVHQYNDKDLARQLYREAGYDPSRMCTNCGKCEDACRSNVPITQILHQLSTQFA